MTNDSQAKHAGGAGLMTRAYVITRVVLRACILCGEQGMERRRRRTARAD